MQIGVGAVVAQGTRCWLVVSQDSEPSLHRMAYWSDGGAVWMWACGGSAEVAALRRDPRCAVYVGGSDGGGALLRGSARLHSPTSPRSLAFHGATSAAAVAVLAARNLPRAVASVADGPRLPDRWVPAGRVVIRVAVDDVASLGPPLDAPGIAPALPTVVPPAVRRALTGRRDVVVATGLAGAVRVAPALWGHGYALSLPGGVSLPAGARAAAALDADARGRPSAVAGLQVSGTVAGAGLRVERVRWWDGRSEETVAVPAAAGRAAGITLPD